MVTYPFTFAVMIKVLTILAEVAEGDPSSCAEVANLVVHLLDLGLSRGLVE